MLELEEINSKLSPYFQGIEELEMLHKALKKQNTHLIPFADNTDEIKSYCEKYRLKADSTIICADVELKNRLYDFLYVSPFKNYLLLQKGSQEANYSHLNFIIYLQRQKFTFRDATFDKNSTFSTEETEDLFRTKNASSQVKKHFAIVFNELLMNAILHGQTPVPKLSFATFSDYLIFRVEDKKGAFDFENLKKVFNTQLKEVNPEEIRTAGIGLNIVFKYTSGLMYEVDPGKSTIVTFFINLNRTHRDCSFIFCRSISAQEQYPLED